MTITTGLDASSQFQNDLATLTATKLRQKYRGEANCHANMKRRAKEGRCEIDPAWEDFRAFLADMGPRLIPDGSIDRIDNANRRYGPGLCRWATKEEQTRNRENTKWLLFDGEKMPVGEFAKAVGIPYSTVHSALQRGEAPEAIAHRAQHRDDAAGYYMPTSADTPRRRELFEDGYIRWTKKVKRPDRRKYLSREAYAVIRAANVFKRAVQTLESVGINEVAPGEEEEFEVRHAQTLRIYRDALSWAQEAARALINKDPSFGAKIYPVNEGALVRLASYEAWFEDPNE